MKYGSIFFALWFLNVLGAGGSSGFSSSSSSAAPSADSSPVASKKSSPVAAANSSLHITCSPLVAGVPLPETFADSFDERLKSSASDLLPARFKSRSCRPSISGSLFVNEEALHERGPSILDPIGGGAGPKVVVAQTQLAISKDRSMPSEIAGVLKGYADSTVDFLIDRFKNTKKKLPSFDYNSLFIPHVHAQDKQKIDAQIKEDVRAKEKGAHHARAASAGVFKQVGHTPEQLKKMQLGRLLALYYHRKNNPHDSKAKEIEKLFCEQRLLSLTIPAYITRARQREFLARKFINYMAFEGEDEPRKPLVVGLSPHVRDEEFEQQLMDFYQISDDEVACRMNHILQKYGIKGSIKCEALPAEVTQMDLKIDAAAQAASVVEVAIAPGKITRQRSKSS